MQQPDKAGDCRFTPHMRGHEINCRWVHSHCVQYDDQILGWQILRGFCYGPLSTKMHCQLYGQGDAAVLDQLFTNF